MTYAFSPLACLSLAQDRPLYFDERLPSDIYLHPSSSTSYLIENRNIHCDETHMKYSY